MSWAYSGGVLTQTGTDTDLTGLSGLTGVTTRTEAQTIYTLDNVRISVQGSLTYDAGTERIEFINWVYASLRKLIQVNSGATLTINSTLDSVTRDFYPAVDFGAVTLNFSSGPYMISIESGGVATLKGTYIFNSSGTTGNFAIVEGTGTFQDFTVINTDTSVANVQIRGTGVCNMIDVVLRGVLVNALSTSFINTFNNFTIEQIAEALVVRFGSTVTGVVTASNLSSNNISGDTIRLRTLNGDLAFKSFNPSDGNSSTWERNHDGTGALYGTIWQDVVLSFLDENGSAISSKTYGTDIDNGNRVANFTVDGETFTVATTRTYTDSGTSANFEVLTQVIKSTGASDPDWNSPDNRGVSDGANIPFKTIEYTKDITSSTPAIEGIGSKAIDIVLLPDFTITESTKATVDAYTTVDNGRELYDRAKSDLYDNFAGETETTIDREGTQVDLKNLDITIDATAASVYDLTTGMITIKSSAYTGGFTDATSITQSNGATISSLVLINSTWNAVQTNWTGSADATSIINVASVDTYDATGFTFDASSTISNTSGSEIFVIINSGDTEPTTTGSTVTFIDAGIDVTFTNLTSANVQIFDDSATVVQRSISQTGTLVYNVPDTGVTGTWGYVVNRAGYTPIIGTFDPVLQNITVNSTLSIKKATDGGNLYQGTTCVFLTVVPVADGTRMNLRIGDGSVPVQCCLDETEDALQTEDGMSYLYNAGGQVNIAILPNGSWLFLGANVRLIRDTVTDSNAAVSGLVDSVDGQPVDDTNGEVRIIQSTLDVNVTEVNSVAVTNIDDFKADVSGLSTFDNTVDEVITDAASRTASKADVSALATTAQLTSQTTDLKGTSDIDNTEIYDKITSDASTNKSDLTIINNGVKKASKIIPHNTDLT